MFLRRWFKTTWLTEGELNKLSTAICLLSTSLLLNSTRPTHFMYRTVGKARRNANFQVRNETIQNLGEWFCSTKRNNEWNRYLVFWPKNVRNNKISVCLFPTKISRNRSTQIIGQKDMYWYRRYWNKIGKNKTKRSLGKLSTNFARN